MDIDHTIAPHLEIASKCAKVESTATRDELYCCFDGLALMQVNKLVDKAHVLLKVAVILANYTTEAVTERMRPNPDLCRFAVVTEVASLVKECREREQLQFIVGPQPN